MHFTSPDQIQAWSAIIQAFGAITALGVTIAIPYIQRHIEAKVRLVIRPNMLWFTHHRPTGKARINSVANLTTYDKAQLDLGRGWPAIEIQNHSSFSVKINEILLTEGKKRSKQYLLSDCLYGKPWPDLPCTIPPRETLRIVFTDAVFKYRFSSKTLVSVRTQNGYYIYHETSIWRAVRREHCQDIATN